MSIRKSHLTEVAAFSLKELVVFLGAVALFVIVIVPKKKGRDEIAQPSKRHDAQAVVASIANTRTLSAGENAAIRVAGENGEEQEFRVSLDERQRVTLLPYRPVAEEYGTILFDGGEDID